LVEEEKTHARKDHAYGEEVFALRFLPQKRPSEEGDIHRSAVLEDDSIGSGGQFGGENKERYRPGVRESTSYLDEGETEPRPLEIEEENAGGDSTSSTGDSQRMPGDRLNQYASHAPEKCRTQKEESTPMVLCHGTNYNAENLEEGWKGVYWRSFPLSENFTALFHEYR